MCKTPKYEYSEIRSWGKIASPKWKDRLLADQGYECWVIPYSAGNKCKTSDGFPISTIFLKRDKLPVKIWAIKKGALNSKKIKTVTAF